MIIWTHCRHAVAYAGVVVPPGLAFRDGAIPTAGTAITQILPPASRFSKNNDHATKKQRVLDRLAEFFDRYFGLT
jgi:type I restriction enzyme R subunit